jgi:hypothetical protein
MLLGGKQHSGGLALGVEIAVFVHPIGGARNHLRRGGKSASMEPAAVTM